MQSKRRLQRGAQGRKANFLGLGVPVKWSEEVIARLASQEWVDDFDAVELLAMLHVLGEKDAAAGLLGHPQYESIPERKAM